MISFDHYKKITEVSESGMAFAGVQTSRIPKENIGPTAAPVMQLLAKFGFRRSDFAFLGSTGKKDTSGDIDLGVHADPILDYYDMDMDHLGDALKKLQQFLAGHYGDVKVIFGNQISLAVPQFGPGGKNIGTFSQLDLMFTPSLEASTFYYHSPAQDESQYKGAVRTMLLMAIAIHFDRRDLGNGSQERYWFDKWYGLVKGIETKIGAKRIGSSKETVTTLPEEVVHILLGPSFQLSDANSFESLWKAIHSPKFVNKGELAGIEQTFREMMAKAKYNLPKGV